VTLLPTAAIISAAGLSLHIPDYSSNLYTNIMLGNHVLMATEGTVYLLHFARPYRFHAR
jgi:hypothetical protein